MQVHFETLRKVRIFQVRSHITFQVYLLDFIFQQHFQADRLLFFLRDQELLQVASTILATFIEPARIARSPAY